MKRRTELIFIVFMAVTLASAGSHLLVRWLKIETKTARFWKIENSKGDFGVFLGGSSLAGDAVNWERVATNLDLSIFGWGVAGSSPYEWDALRKKRPETRDAILVFSPYDLNEAALSDFRA